MSVKKRFKSALLDAFAQPFMGRVLASYGGPRCAVLMLHRFGAPEGVHVGHDVAKLRDVLANLRRIGVAFVDVEDAVSAMDDAGASGAADIPPSLSVAFTVDDGYADLVEVAGPVFSEFDCPVTGFVVPDVIDGRSWFWWDKIEWVLRHSVARTLRLELAGEQVTLAWHDDCTRRALQIELGERLKTLAYSALLEFVAALSEAADVPLPEQAPREYRVLQWDELRSAERSGMRFGAHSMSHPILSRCDDARASYEVAESVRRVNENLSAPANIFCYPNGKLGDFGIREFQAVRAAGVRAALTSEPGLLRPRGYQPPPDSWRLEIPRFAYDERAGGVARLLAG